jgi:DNA-binding beta-propeller fold protein YncE
MRRLPHALAVAGLAAVLAGCGGGDGGTTTAEDPRPQLDPPQAAEPVAGPAVEAAVPGRTVKVGAKPEGVAVDPQTHTVAVAVQSPDQLVLLDDRDGRVLRRVSLPGQARHVGLAKPGGPFLVPVETADKLMAVDPRTGRSQVTGVGNHPHDAAAIGDRYYTADEFGSTISVVRDGKLRRVVTADAQPGGIAAVNGQLALIAVRAYTIELFKPDGDGLQGGGAQSAGLGPSHVATGPSGRIAITDTRGQAMVVYDTVPRLRFRARVPLGGTPVGIAADPGRGVVWTTLSERARAVAVDLRAEKPAIVKRVQTLRNPFSVGVDTATGRLSVASRTDGTLQLVDP